MKRFLTRLLGAFGLVSARRYDMLSRAVAEAKAGSAEWKARTGEALVRVRTLEAGVRRQTHVAEKLRTSLEKQKQRREDIQKLRLRLADAERELVVAREHLMAIEVKLDILEGAANVLDARTRATVVRPRSETGASA
jgi:type I site-specific restriction endonuclease